MKFYVLRLVDWLPNAVIYDLVVFPCNREFSILSLYNIKAVSILTGRDTDFRKWSVEWPTNV
jgi:hypothetical protein